MSLTPLRLILPPVLTVNALWRFLSRSEPRWALRERLGHGQQGRGDAAAVVWLHGASLGELTAARPLIDRLRQDQPGMKLVVTAHTMTGRGLIGGWQGEGIIAALAPIDAPGALRRFLGRWRPDLSIAMESELWPLRLAALRRGGIPLILAAGRISARSARRWQARAQGGRGGATGPLGAIDRVYPMDAEQAERFAAMGIEAGRIGPPLNLKARVALDLPDAQELAALARLYPRADCVLAASTHPGEESLALDAFVAARRSRPALRLVLAPRHPERGDALGAQIAARGLTCWRRSQDGAPAQRDVILADSLGEMALWYSLAHACFVGGSVTDMGGHTPVEPVQFGCQVIVGPHRSNHARAYRALQEAGALTAVADASGLGLALAAAPAGTAAAERARAAIGTLANEAADLGPLMARIAAILKA